MLMWMFNDVFNDVLSGFTECWSLSPRISLLLCWHVDLACVCWQFGKHDQDTRSEVCHWESSLRRNWVNGGCECVCWSPLVLIWIKMNQAMPRLKEMLCFQVLYCYSLCTGDYSFKGCVIPSCISPGKVSFSVEMGDVLLIRHGDGMG